jgi:hypothetical protein
MEAHDMAKTTRNSAGCLIVLIAVAAIAIWLLADNGTPPPPIVGLWRFTEIPYTVEFRSDLRFVQASLGDKNDIWNQGTYVVDDTKNPAWIDIYGEYGRTFGILGAGDGSYKGSIRFLTPDVAEIVYSPSGDGYSGRPDSFDNDYKIVLYRIK